VRDSKLVRGPLLRRHAPRIVREPRFGDVGGDDASHGVEHGRSTHHHGSKALLVNLQRLHLRRSPRGGGRDHRLRRLRAREQRQRAHDVPGLDDADALGYRVGIELGRSSRSNDIASAGTGDDVSASSLARIVLQTQRALILPRRDPAASRADHVTQLRLRQRGLAAEEQAGAAAEEGRGPERFPLR